MLARENRNEVSQSRISARIGPQEKENVSTSTAVIGNRREFKPQRAVHLGRGGLDVGILIGIAIAVVALAAGIAATGISASYFFQPTSVLIVVGGTVGAMLITTPHPTLILAFRRALKLFSTEDSPNREKMIEEIVSYAKVVRIQGMLAIEPGIDHVSHDFLREALLLAMDTTERNELQSALENKIRFCEKQSETAAKVLEVAGGLTPTIGVLGTVVGLIDVLRHFSSLPTIAYGVGTAFTSTFYGLALANLALLPAAYRIRAWASETFDLQEMMTEGTLCLFDGVHPRLVRQRLRSFLSVVPDRDDSIRAFESAADAVRQ
jgi:chemotaxis protein MotA